MNQRDPAFDDQPSSEGDISQDTGSMFEDLESDGAAGAADPEAPLEPAGSFLEPEPRAATRQARVFLGSLVAEYEDDEESPLVGDGGIQPSDNLSVVEVPYSEPAKMSEASGWRSFFQGRRSAGAEIYEKGVSREEAETQQPQAPDPLERVRNLRNRGKTEDVADTHVPEDEIGDVVPGDSFGGMTIPSPQSKPASAYQEGGGFAYQHEEPAPAAPQEDQEAPADDREMELAEAAEQAAAEGLQSKLDEIRQAIAEAQSKGVTPQNLRSTEPVPVEDAWDAAAVAEVPADAASEDDLAHLFEEDEAEAAKAVEDAEPGLAEVFGGDPGDDLDLLEEAPQEEPDDEFLELVEEGMAADVDAGPVAPVEEPADSPIFEEPTVEPAAEEPEFEETAPAEEAPAEVPAAAEAEVFEPAGRAADEESAEEPAEQLDPFLSTVSYAGLGDGEQRGLGAGDPADILPVGDDPEFRGALEQGHEDAAAIGGRPEDRYFYEGGLVEDKPSEKPAEEVIEEVVEADLDDEEDLTEEDVLDGDVLDEEELSVEEEFELEESAHGGVPEEVASLEDIDEIGDTDVSEYEDKELLETEDVGEAVEASAEDSADAEVDPHSREWNITADELMEEIKAEGRRPGEDIWGVTADELMDDLRSWQSKPGVEAVGEPEDTATSEETDFETSEETLSEETAEAGDAPLTPAEAQAPEFGTPAETDGNAPSETQLEDLAAAADRLETGFDEAQLEYVAAWDAYHNGVIDEARLRERAGWLVIEHDGDRWVIGFQSGLWYRDDETEGWIQDTPPSQAAAGVAQDQIEYQQLQEKLDAAREASWEILSSYVAGRLDAENAEKALAGLEVTHGGNTYVLGAQSGRWYVQDGDTFTLWGKHAS